VREWSQTGISDIYGVDGDYVKPNSLLIPREKFAAVNLAGGFDLKRKFDLVQSLEVAEHLPNAASRRFVEALITHSRGLVFFSAAVPGQGGEGHVNEQPYEFWRELFRSFGYHPVDAIRPEIANDTNVSYWYRYNSLLYMREDLIDRLPVRARLWTVPVGEPIADVAPLTYHLRTRIIRALPQWAVKGLSRVLAKIHSRPVDLG
jgi:hypothetical protein